MVQNVQLYFKTSKEITTIILLFISVLWLVTLIMTVWSSHLGFPQCVHKSTEQWICQTLPPMCLLNAAFTKGKVPRITQRRSYFQRFQLTYQELWESASAKTTFLYCDRAQTSRVKILSGVKYVFITDVLQLMLRTAWSFSVYVHCTSFSIHLGNFIKLKKCYNRYLAFDPLFALVWCRWLSNDTEHCAGWLYSEITKWVKRDFVPNNKGRMGYFFI